MRRKTATVFECDGCGKQVIDPNEHRSQGLVISGRHFMEGWYTLSGPLNTHLSISGNPEHHFCSRACLVEWLKWIKKRG